MKGKLFLVLQFIQILIILLSFSLLISGCNCIPCNEKEEALIPLDILKKADQFIISKTGDEFFKKYITVDFYNSKHIEPNYLIVYKFYIPEKPFVNELIRFTIDSTGKVLTQYEVVGIPECRANEMDCDFVVDDKIAKQIAVENGLPNGIKDWKVDFVWEAKYKKYVWHLFSTLKESKGDFGYRADGEQMVIDPNNASIIYQDSWQIK